MTCITLKNGRPRIRAGEIATGNECCTECDECEPGPKRVTWIMQRLQIDQLFALGFVTSIQGVADCIDAESDVAVAFFEANGYSNVSKTCQWFGPNNGSYSCTVVAYCNDWGDATCGFFTYPDDCPDMYVPNYACDASPGNGNESIAYFDKNDAGVWVDDCAALPLSRCALGLVGIVAPCAYAGANPLP